MLIEPTSDMLPRVGIQHKPNFRAFQSWARLGYQYYHVDPKSLEDRADDRWGRG